MCKPVPRKRFFGSSRSDSEMSLPTTIDPPPASRSKSVDGRLDRVRSPAKGTRRRSLSSVETYGHAENNGTNEYYMFQQQHGGHSQKHGLTLASITGCLLLAVLGAVLFQREVNLEMMLEVKHEIVQHLHQLQTLRDQISPFGQAMRGDLDGTDKQLYHLEHERMRTRQSIQLLSQRLLKEKYGPGPKYYVEMQLSFDPVSNIYDEETDQEPATVVIETARIEDMPHSIFHFLELVSHHVYDGTTFHKRANHIVQAGPSTQTEDQQRSPLQLDPSLANIIFQEYSPEISHAPYTIGFPGRPGGPDFYINMRDNSQIHGPGGQARHYGDAVGDPDPCFGFVVTGMDVIDKIHQSDVKPIGWRDIIAHPVLIKKMTILGDNSDPQASSSPLRGRN